MAHRAVDDVDGDLARPSRPGCASSLSPTEAHGGTVWVSSNTVRANSAVAARSSPPHGARVEVRRQAVRWAATRSGRIVGAGIGRPSRVVRSERVNDCRDA